jgi:hypothetical protein
MSSNGQLEQFNYEELVAQNLFAVPALFFGLVWPALISCSH